MKLSVLAENGEIDTFSRSFSKALSKVLKLEKTCRRLDRKKADGKIAICCGRFIENKENKKID